MTQKYIEKQSLIISSIANFIMAGAGYWIFATTNIQALFLDFFFSLIGFISTVVAVVISKKSRVKTKSYPDGLYFLEPLYAIMKSLLVLALLLVSVLGTSTTAYDYFSKGVGEPMNIAPVLPYAISMVILCFGLSYFNSKQNKKINNVSTILKAESKSNFIDGLQSLGIGVGILILNLIEIKGSLGFLHYTGDFFITAVLVLFSIKEPVKILINSFRELSNGTTDDKQIKKHINEVIKPHLNNLSSHTKCDIFKIGMHIKIRISLDGEVNSYTYTKYTSIREKVIKELRTYYDSIELVYDF